MRILDGLRWEVNTMINTKPIKHEENAQLVLIMIALFVVCALMICCGNAEAEIVDSGTCGKNGNNVTWILDDQNTLVISGTGAMRDYDSLTLAPWSTSLRTVVINDGVTSIGCNSFENCKDLTAIIIPYTVTGIGDWAFYDCSSLKSITIPNSVVSIGKGAFSGCRSLTCLRYKDNEIQLDGVESSWFCNSSVYWLRDFSNTLYLYGSGKTKACSGDWGYDIESAIILDGITSIDDGMFFNCKRMVSVTIPTSVTSIGSNAFQDCIKLSSITIPDNVTSIGQNAFYGCNATRYAYLDSSSAKTLGKLGYSFRIPGKNYDLRYTYADNEINGLSIINVDKNAISLTIPENVTTIGYGSLSNCNLLTSITIPEGVTHINDQAFINCTKLKRICFQGETTVFGNNVCSNMPTIYCYGFSDAESWATDNNYPVVLLDNIELDSIREIAIPEYLRLPCGEFQTIPVNLFPNDGTEIAWDSSNPAVISIENGVITALSMGCSTITATIGSASDSMEIEVYIIPNSFVLNHEEAWLIAKEDLQLSIVSVEPNDAELDAITWTSSDTNLATVDSNGLITTKKPGDVTITATSNGIVRECVLHLFYPVTAIELESGEVELKQSQSFQLIANVTARTQATVNRLVSFESSDPAVATVDENGMVTAHTPGTTTVTATAASGVSASRNVTVREANTLTLPSGVTAIEDEAFMDNTSIEAVIVPDGCASIGERTFAGCSNLVYVRIPVGLTDIAENAFEGCENVRIERDGE